MSDLAIVIVSFNARAHLESCLESVRRQRPAVSHELVLVDNASTDGSAAGARQHADIRVMELERNVGFAAASNRGIRATSGELVLLLNPDTIVTPGAIDQLVSKLRADPTVAVAGPRLVDPTGRMELSFGRMISPLTELRQKLIGALYDRRWGMVERWVEQQTQREQYVDWVSGACLLVRRADAEAVGLLDERFFMYTEDVDFCQAIRARGRRILFTPAAEIIHARGRSRAAAPDSARAAYRRSQLAFYAKHHPGWTPWLRLYLKMKREL